MVERRLDVYCLSNMGLHVLIDGHSILIDALNNGEQRPYAGIPLDMAQTIIRGGPPYERVDMMLISMLGSLRVLCWRGLMCPSIPVCRWSTQ